MRRWSAEERARLGFNTPCEPHRLLATRAEFRSQRYRENISGVGFDMGCRCNRASGAAIGARAALNRRQRRRAFPPNQSRHQMSLASPPRRQPSSPTRDDGVATTATAAAATAGRMAGQVSPSPIALPRHQLTATATATATATVVTACCTAGESWRVSLFILYHAASSSSVALPLHPLLSRLFILSRCLFERV